MSISVTGGAVAAELRAGASFGVLNAQSISHVPEACHWQRIDRATTTSMAVSLSVAALVDGIAVRAAAPGNGLCDSTITTCDGLLESGTQSRLHP